ncbi:ABC-2 transporter permease [Bacillus chungangensis]|uniref:ABC-2 transporter permease n=1 Tax=Bacillus chungangensis TaxID=587633 RepID=UPI00351FFE5F
MYPFILKFGTEKSDPIIFLSSGLSVVLMFSISILLSLFVPSISFRSPIVVITSLIVSVLLFILSYFLAVWIHRNKEYN